ncbi:MAG: PAS domain S-box protein [Deltaproteobacteria bacterium]|nr:PAS domain S-box protein [Deltaproteobacteria bacterium]
MSEPTHAEVEVARLRQRVAELEGERDRLRHDAAQMEQLLTVVPNMVIRFDRALRITYLNRCVPPLTVEQVLGRPMSDFMPPRSWAAAAPVIAQVLSSGVPTSYAIDGQGPHETVAHYQTDVTAVREGETIVGGLLSTIDVTAMQRREQSVAEREAMLKLALAATGLGLWTWEIDRNRIIWDERMQEITGYPTPVDLAAYTTTVVHPDDRDLVSADGGRLLAGESIQRTHRIVRPDGEVRWAMVIARPTMNAQGKLAVVVGGLIDVTSQRRVEEELRHVHRLNAVGTLTAGVAHNFNNLLTVILPSLELVRRVVPGDHAAIVDDAIGAATRAAELVHQLMTYAGKRLPRAPSTVDLATVIERSTAVCARTLGGGIAIDCRVTPGLPPVRGDATDVEQVLLNLLFNARDALLPSAREPRRIVIEAGADTVDGSELAYLRVTDNGTGMDADTLQRACEPFFTTKAVGAGTGLGLATSMAVARELGGKLELSSQAGQGTAATLWLPVAEGSTFSRARPPRPAEAPPTTVLLVDDDPLVRRATSRLLELKGCRVVCAEGGALALEALTRDRFDVILLDRSLAAGADAELVGQLRARGQGARLLYFTGDALSEGQSALVDGVVRKPVNAEQLLAAVRARRAQA